MNKKALFVPFFMLAWGCTKNPVNNSTSGSSKTGQTSLASPVDVIPDEGVYVEMIYSAAYLASHGEFHANIPYSTRDNIDLDNDQLNDQYTTDKQPQKNHERENSHLILKMDITMPPNATVDAPQPLIVFIHGGGFVAGDKEAWSDRAETYARAGYVVACINYRLTATNVDVPDEPARRRFAIVSALEDAQNAIRFLKQHAATYHIDPTRVAVMGGSAGGAITLTNAVEHDAENDGRVISDFPGISSKPEASVSTGAVLVVATSDPSYDPDFLHYSADDSPVLMFHAKPKDKSTGYTWLGNAVPTKQNINQSGNQCTLVAQPNLTHTVNLSVGTDYFENDILPFFWDKLRLYELR